MKKLWKTVSYSTLLLLASSATGDITVTLPDGQQALLKDDQTWEYIDPPAQAEDEGESETNLEQVVLSVERKKELGNTCRFGLRLRNTTSYRVRHLVPRYSAITKGDVVYETVSREFSEIKPTDEQYREIQFTGISCDEITGLKVHGADHCAMGTLTKFSAEKGACLKRILVEKSDLIDVFKEE